jgi:two-component system, NtrC family, response regulator GlrR
MTGPLLVLDCHPADTLGGTLQRILSSVPSWVIHRQQVPLTENGSAALGPRVSGLVQRYHPDVAFVVLPPSILERNQPLWQLLHHAAAPVPLIVVVDIDQPDEILSLLELGATDFLTPPLTAVETIPRVQRLLEYTHRHQTPLGTLKVQMGLAQLVGQSTVFRAAVERIPLVARCDVSLLIAGETGTGKELCAHAIHHLSRRAHRAFIPVNCGAIPAELVENELFGHERGAFTTAIAAQSGLVAEAEGGTLFLDEIDCLPSLAQVKLLRFLQEREYRPLGSAKMQRADVRVIAAANGDLDEAVRVGRLRQDLYYRLNVIPLRLPPLRERREDIPLLARHFLAKYVAEFDKPGLSLADSAVERLRRYDWPGNVRELEHLITRVVVLAPRAVIEGDDLGLPHLAETAGAASFRDAKNRFERGYVEDLLRAHGGNITKAAETAHKNRRAFWELIRKHHIDAMRFKARGLSRPVTR